MNIEMIGFDADDTLWHTEAHYIKAREDFINILRPWAKVDRIGAVADQIIIDNLPNYGYGIKPFILSLVEAAIRISNSEIRGDQIEDILSIGKRMQAAEVVLRPYVNETLQTLLASYPLMLITKGDLLDQTSKVERSGIENYFSILEIVNEKSSETYARIFKKHNINPSNFLMVGNTIRSDVEPVIALGGVAVYIPADSTWEHEMVPSFDTKQDNFYELEHMGLLAALIAEIDTT